MINRLEIILRSTGVCRQNSHYKGKARGKRRARTRSIEAALSKKIYDWGL
ncbi:hypothetical protein CHK_2390 [Christensenella hongkongensis]|uniref:Uncharacterized protein n=1 Tax=Christensenella hongkongensis TaxID=270498 RepID=A0A0M2NIR2_9FIRM|nr:hypothetical protein CHK_2390 [Christensenella hongkongensis]